MHCACIKYLNIFMSSRCNRTTARFNYVEFYRFLYSLFSEITESQKNVYKIIELVIIRIKKQVFIFLIYIFFLSTVKDFKKRF